MGRATWVVMGLAVLLVPAACDRDEHSAGPTGPSHHFEQEIDEDLFVILREDGSYYAGMQRKGEPPRLPPEPCRWIPWPLKEGERFSTCMFWSEARVFSVGGTLEVPAGVFDNVSVVGNEGEPSVSYSFRPGVWILREYASDLRGGLRTSLADYGLRLSGSTLRDRYGLGLDSRYRYEFSGSDSVGYAYGGSVTAVVAGETELFGETAIVIHRAGTLWTDEYVTGARSLGVEISLPMWSRPSYGPRRGEILPPRESPPR